MKAPAFFWALLKHELTHGYLGGTGQVVMMLLIYWLAIGAFPLVVLFGDSNSQGNIATVFEAGFLPILAFLFLGFLTVWMTYATIPAFGQLLSPGGSVPGAVQVSALEFFFTRAVDRRILFRARTTAFLLVGLTPFFLDLAVSPFLPALRFAPSDVASPDTIRRHQHYLKAFPLNLNRNLNPNPHLPPTPTETTSSLPMVIPHGTVAYAAWLAWTATLAFLILQGYAALIAKRVKPNHWRTVIFPAAPILFLLLWLVVGPPHSLTAQVRVFEDCFLFFSTHPLAMTAALAALAAAVQAWCEQRFCKLEIL
jgi:hypothetical protein